MFCLQHSITNEEQYKKPEYIQYRKLRTKQLVELPRVTFSTIYKFLVERKVALPKVSYLKSIADVLAEQSLKNDVEDGALSSEKTSGTKTEYTLY